MIRVCPQCGTPIDDGEVFCPKCGEEIQVVPDFETVDGHMQEMRMKRQKEEEEKAERKREERLAVLQKKRQLKQWITTIIVVVVLITAALGAGYAMFIALTSNSYEYQMKKAQNAFEAEKYDDAFDYVNKALSIDSNREEGRVLLAEINEAEDDYDSACGILLAVIQDYPDSLDAYTILIRIYESTNKVQEIKTLLDKCMSQTILKEFDEYVCTDPLFSEEAGSYTEQISVEITAHDGSDIYYTLDGTDPTVTSTKYYSAIPVPDGTSVLKAIAVNQHGITSNITSVQYTIEPPVPSPPTIAPKSGEYNSKSTNKITVIVPKGYTAYYAFDELPTLASEKYVEPVDMLEGEHDFYAFVVNEKGQQSDIASATYVYSEKTKTDTEKYSDTKTDSDNKDSYEPESDREKEEGTEQTQETPAPSTEEISPEPTTAPEATTAPDDPEPTSQPETTTEPDEQDLVFY